MRHRYIGGALLAAVAVLTGPGVGQAQFDPAVGNPVPGGDGGGFAVPLNQDPIIHLPTGHPGDAGFYAAADYVMLDQTRALGKQTIASRGFYDSSGNITGVPGTFIGGGTVGLSTKNISGNDYQPGYNIELGWKTAEGVTIFANYTQLMESVYSRGASTIPPGLRPDANLADTFLSSPVYNFTPQFSGPQNKLAVDGVGNNPGFTAYGIWNGATAEEVSFIQRYTQMQFGTRVPLFQTDYSRVYGIAGGQFSWFFERFRWYAVDTDVNGNEEPEWAANYTNTLSQRMYGAMLGIGHEIFVANQFSLSFEMSGSGMMDVAVERAKYELADQSTESKYSANQYRFVPNVNAAINLWWYPTEGVQIRIGYEAMTFYNTLYMQNPVAFNFGDPQPKYGVQSFRLLHGFNVGIGFFF